MHVVITGGAGFLGTKLAAALLARGALTDVRGTARPIARITLVDVTPTRIDDPRVTSIVGDLADPALVARALDASADSVFHLAAVVSGEAEADFDLGWHVNFDATRALLEGCRALAAPARVVYASSCAVFGGPLPDPVPDTQALWPQSSYGNAKAVGEFLVNDYSRKGYIDGRSLRLPTISVRPGKANKAASSFASGILREPLNGVEAVCPVARETRMWLLSPRRAIDSIIVAHETPTSAFSHTRSINLPGISTSVDAMLAALRQVAGDEVASRVTFRPDPVIERIVRTWPVNFDTAFGRALGMQADADFESIVRQYIDDELAA
ncbi:MAG TPA: D-erythronate dehydrogenase [Casimicrobiaceae bacterium]